MFAATERGVIARMLKTHPTTNHRLLRAGVAVLAASSLALGACSDDDGDDDDIDNPVDGVDDQVDDGLEDLENEIDEEVED